MSRRIAERFFALIWSIVGIVVIIAAEDISGGGANVEDALGPKVFPQVVGGILTGLGLWLLLSDDIVRIIGRYRDGATKAPSQPPEHAISSIDTTDVGVPAGPPWRVPLAILITLAYVALLPIIHYLVATIIAGIAMMLLLGARRIPALIIFPVVLAFCAEYVFTEVVGVILP